MRASALQWGTWPLFSAPVACRTIPMLRFETGQKEQVMEGIVEEQTNRVGDSNADSYRSVLESEVETEEEKNG